MWFDSFFTDNTETETYQGIVKALQAKKWKDALAILRGIPDLDLRVQLKVLFCELSAQLMHRRLDPNVSTNSLNGTLGEMNAYLSANIITALRAHMHTVCVAA